MKQLGVLELNEAVIDVQFEFNGLFISILLENSGVIWYQTNNFQIALKLVLPIRLVLSFVCFFLTVNVCICMFVVCVCSYVHHFKS